MNFYRWLRYMTNNEQVSRHEVAFDIIFFIVNTLALLIGSILFIKYNEPQWIAVLIIEYSWALDNMRHNRP
jgi:hypothetical protein